MTGNSGNDLRRVALCVAALCFHSPASRAQTAERSPRFDLSWDAPAGCPDEAALRRRIEQLLGPTPAGAPRVLTARGFVTTDAGSVGLHLETFDSERKQRGERTLRGSTCEEVSAAGALVIALAIDPKAVAEHGAASTPAFDGAPGATASGSPAAALDTPAPDGAPPPGPAPARATPRPAGAPPSIAAAPPPPPAPVPARSSGVRGALLARTALDVGALPSTAFGVGLAAGFDFGRALRVRAGALYFPPHFASARDEPSNRGADVSLAVGDLAACYLLGSVIRVGACAGFEAGLLIAEGRNFGDVHTVTRPWIAPEAALILSATVAGPLFVDASAGVSLPLGRSQVGFTKISNDSRELQPLYRPAAASFRAAFGVGLFFQ